MKKQKRSLGLSGKLNLAIVLSITLVFAVLTFFVSRAVRTGIYEVEKANLVQSTESLNELMGLEIKFLRSLVSVGAGNTTFSEELRSGDLVRSQEVLQGIDASSDYLENSFLLDRDGKVAAADQKSLLGKDYSGSDFYQACFRMGSGLYMDKYVTQSSVSGVPVLFMAAPVQSPERVEGVLVIALNIEKFSEDYITSKTFGESGYPFIVDDRGITVAHPSREIVWTDITKENFFLAMRDESNSHKDLIRYEWEGRMKYLVHQELEYLPWILATTIYESDLLSMSSRIMRLILAISGVSLAVIVLFMIFLNRRLIIRRILSFVDGIEKAATGDLSVRVRTGARDEITFMHEKFNELLEKLGALLRDTLGRMDSLRETGFSLSSNIEETAASVNQINANIESTRNQVENQASNVTETSATVEQMTKNIESLNRSIESQSASVNQSSASIEEMIANIKSISTVTEQASREVSELRTSSEDGRQKLSRVSQLITEISRSSEDLLEANSLISNIAGQTNLLAMNAAIEAAHAGEAGKGFAVVADEIRKLAELSTNQSKDVEKNLKGIKGSIDAVVSTSDDTSEAFEKVLSSIGSVIRTFDEINQSLLEQSSGSQQVLSALSSMQGITETVRTGSFEMTAGNRQILTAVTSLNTITQEIRGAIEEISRGTGEINRAIMSIAELGTENRDNIEAVVQKSSLFTLE